MTEPLYAAVEAGGTKTLCAVIDAQLGIRAQCRIPTTGPGETLDAVCAFFADWQQRHGPLHAAGIASFGPLRLDPAAGDHGRLLRTPKPGWSDFDWLAGFGRCFAGPLALDTDVNAAALAEQRWGAGRGCGNLIYITVGTGIGGGVLVEGRPLHGLMHAELGHLRPRRHAEDGRFAGICPFHGDCLEGLASGPAIIARSGASLAELPDTDPAWRIEADYLGQLCAQATLTISPQRIVLGGGVMQQTALFDGIRQRLHHWLGGYVPALARAADLERYVVAPGLGTQSGILGALALALGAEQAADPAR